MGDVIPAAIECFDFVGINVEADDGNAFFGKSQRKRQTDIAQADDTDQCRVLVYFFVECCLGDFSW